MEDGKYRNAVQRSFLRLQPNFRAVCKEKLSLHRTALRYFPFFAKWFKYPYKIHGHLPSFTLFFTIGTTSRVLGLTIGTKLRLIFLELVLMFTTRVIIQYSWLTKYTKMHRCHQIALRFQTFAPRIHYQGFTDHRKSVLKW